MFRMGIYCKLIVCVFARQIEMALLFDFLSFCVSKPALVMESERGVSPLMCRGARNSRCF